MVQFSYFVSAVTAPGLFPYIAGGLFPGSKTAEQGNTVIALCIHRHVPRLQNAGGHANAAQDIIYALGINPLGSYWFQDIGQGMVHEVGFGEDDLVPTLNRSQMSRRHN